MWIYRPDAADRRSTSARPRRDHASRAFRSRIRVCVATVVGGDCPSVCESVPANRHHWSSRRNAVASPLRRPHRLGPSRAARPRRSPRVRPAAAMTSPSATATTSSRRAASAPTSATPPPSECRHHSALAHGRSIATLTGSWPAAALRRARGAWPLPWEGAPCSYEISWPRRSSAHVTPHQDTVRDLRSTIRCETVGSIRTASC